MKIFTDLNLKIFRSRLALTTTLMFVLCVTVFGQQIPYLNHYYYDAYLINPAAAGQSKEIQSSLFFRQQWVGIPGAPETQALIVHGRIPNRNIGLGLTFNNDATDVLSRTSILGSASYTIPLATDHALTFGMSIGALRYKLDFEKIRGDLTDEGLLSNASNSTRVEGAAGLAYTLREKLHVGLVSEQLFSRTFTFIDEPGNKNISFKLVRHYTAYASHEFRLDPKLTLTPLVILRSAQGLSSQFDMNAKVAWNDVVWLNLQHRIGSGSALSMGAAITNQLRIGYTYELPSTAIRAAASSSHEFMLALKFKPQKRKVSETSQRIVNTPPQSGSDEQIDELRQKNEMMSEKILEQKRQLDKQRDEIEGLRKAMGSVESEMREMIRRDSVDLGVEEDFDDQYEYMVIIGAVKRLSEARAYQKMIQRQVGIHSEIKHNHLQTWYFIYSHVVTSNREAVEEIKDLKSKGIEKVIIGNPWVYKSKRGR